MIEIRRKSCEDLLPIGAILWKGERLTPSYALYDIYEGEDEFVEIWLPLKPSKEATNG